MSGLELLLTALAGGVGAGLRYIVDAIVVAGRPLRFPYGILVVNATGSLALGLLVGVVGHAGSAALVLGVGLLGGYTTFSTVSVETVLLAEEGRRRSAVINALGTVVACLAVAGLGLTAGGALTAWGQRIG
ncbi:MAG: fluoride efflux transporter CrcB [Microbacterium sp.]|uniref:fluoride efflux transporter FluC n=1 Tax=unclassified Microbacterium TaxID=2609290 RepID=UPI000DB19978|nr:CrcB family protein [Microbacterium sp.]PZU36259.1 MAG: fluoride efflux transporter CrcB [Microbacterium sp.]